MPERDASPGPLMLDPEAVGHPSVDGLAAWIGENRAHLADEKRRRGALVFRAFSATNADDFQNLISAFGAVLMDYEEGLSRRVGVAAGATARLFPTTTYPANQTICMHNELCHTWKPPRNLFLFCVTPPQAGGRTPITDGRDIWARLSPRVREHFGGGAGDRSLLYLSNLPSRGVGLQLGRPWQDVYGTDDRDIVGARLDTQGTRFEWQPSGGLRTWRRGPVTVPHPETGETVWFNQSMLWHVSNLGARGQKLREKLGEQGVPTNAFFDEGEPIDDAILQETRDTMWAARISFEWQTGDFVVVDNYRMLHGREAFRGERLILLAMSEN
jgi:hypothetical protein